MKFQTSIFIILWFLHPFFLMGQKIKTEKIYSYSDNEISSAMDKKHLAAENQYLPNGMLSSKKVYNREIPTVYVYTYNEQDLPLYISTLDNNGYLLMEWLYVYNKQGLKIEEAQHVGTDVETCSVYSYNQAGLLVEQQNFIYNENQASANTIHWFYNKKNLIEKEIMFDHNKQKIYEHLFEYDEHKRLSKQRTLNKRNDISRIKTYLYRNNDSIAEQVTLKNENLPLSKQSFEYNNTSGNKEMQIWYKWENNQWQASRKEVYQYKKYNGKKELLNEIKMFLREDSIPINRRVYEYEFY